MATTSGQLPTELGVVFVTFNSQDWIGKSVNAVVVAAESLGVAVHIVVADNASQDDTLEVARQAAPDCDAVLLPRNGGFGYAANAGFARCTRTEPILLLNPDVIVSASTLEIVLKAYRDYPTAGLIGCRLVREDGSLDLAAKRNLPSSKSAVVGLMRRVAPWIPASLDHYRASDVAADETAYVSALCGAFMLIRPETLSATGGFDEAFFMYGEDLDFAKRAQDCGAQVLYVGHATAMHAKNASINATNIGRTAKWHRDAMRIYFDKHLAAQHSAAVRVAFRSAIDALWILRAARLRLQRRRVI